MSRKRPKWQLHTPAPMPEPPPSTPVAADDEQMAELMQLMGADAGPRMITAALADATPLDIEARRQLLSGYSLRPTIRAVSTLYARLDAGAEKAADAAIERQFLQSAPGDIAAGAAKALNAGHKLMPPASLTQLTREAIEWCALDDKNNESLGPEGGDAALTNEDLLHLVVSINTEHDTHPAFPSGEPTDEQLQQYNDELAGDEEKLFAEASRQMLWEFARLQANAITLPVQVLGETHETWFKGWPDKVSRDLVGDAPPDAFEMATGVTLRDFIKLGLHLYEASNVGASAYTRSSLLTPGIDAGVVKRLLAEASLPIDKYRKRLAAERKKGDLMHRWYTFAERPILQLSDDEYLVLRPAWLLGRCCGPQLYWDTFFNLGTENDARGEQFSQGMNYVFERNIDYLLRRVTKRAGGAITLIKELQMQDAWKKGGKTPSTCDWVLVSGRFCLVIDATNHWLDAGLAQGFAQSEDFDADVDETFIDKKFTQIRSTIDLISENGWENCTFDENTIYVPLVVVPNAGMPATALVDFDMRMRAHSVLGDLGKSVVAPGFLTWHELQVIEGICEHRSPAGFVELLAEWRYRCTTGMPMRPQTFFDLKGFDRPLGSFPPVARAGLMKALQS